ncbi:hypothetical protein Hanom_Chr04g00362891 [Helianthus anomalus]
MLCSFVPMHILFILSCKVVACTMRCLPCLSFSSCHSFATFHFYRFFICCSLNAGSRAFVKRNLSRSESLVTCNLIGFPSFTICSGICLSFYCINFTFGWLISYLGKLFFLFWCFGLCLNFLSLNIMQALSGHENVVQFHNAYEDTTCT